MLNIRTAGVQRWLNWVLVGLGVVMAIAANLPEEVAAEWGIQRQYLIYTLALVLVFALVRYVHFAFVLTVVALAIGANLPTELAESLHVDSTILTVTLIVIAALSLGNSLFEKLRTRSGHVGPERRRGDRLVQAIRDDDIQSVDELLRDGLSANMRTMTEKTPLMMAAALGFSDVVRLLLRHGADVRARDMEGATPLSVANRNGHEHIADLLVSAGALE